MTDKNADGKALRERVEGLWDRLVDTVKDEDWQRLYKFLKEWQLLGMVLLFLEGIEDSANDIHG